MILPEWSKHKGKEVEEVPSDYLHWLIEQDWMEKERLEELYEAIEYELDVRDRSDGHFYGDER